MYFECRMCFSVQRENLLCKRLHGAQNEKDLHHWRDMRLGQDHEDVQRQNQETDQVTYVISHEETNELTNSQTNQTPDDWNPDAAWMRKLNKLEGLQRQCQQLLLG